VLTAEHVPVAPVRPGNRSPSEASSLERWGGMFRGTNNLGEWKQKRGNQ
jgi:hypothetical protein